MTKVKTGRRTRPQSTSSKTAITQERPKEQSTGTQKTRRKSSQQQKPKVKAAPSNVHAAEGEFSYVQAPNGKDALAVHSNEEANTSSAAMKLALNLFGLYQCSVHGVEDAAAVYRQRILADLPCKDGVLQKVDSNFLARIVGNYNTGQRASLVQNPQEGTLVAFPDKKALAGIEEIPRLYADELAKRSTVLDIAYLPDILACLKDPQKYCPSLIMELYPQIELDLNLADLSRDSFVPAPDEFEFAGWIWQE
jgi:hypothetical protein